MGTSICSVNYFCFGALLIFVGSVLLCALGFTIVLPYEATRDWPETTCYVINASYHPHICSCDRQPTFDIEEFDTCVGKYPCLQIYVRFSIPMPTLERERFTNESFEGTEYPSSPTQVTPNHARHRRKSPDVLLENVTRNGSESELSNTTDHDTYFLETETYRKKEPDKDVSISSTYSVPALARSQPENGEYSSASPLGSDHDKANTESQNTGIRLENSSISRKSVTAAGPKEDVLSGGGSGKMLLALLFRSWTDAFYKQCTLHECGDKQWNRQESSRYRVSYGSPPSQYPCYIDPADPSRVILEKTPRVHMLHAVVWPTVCLSLGALLWIGLCLGCWKLDTETEAEKYRHKYGALK